MGKPVHISVVIPVYGCEKCLIQLYSRLKKALESLTEYFEIILVNDSSKDNAWKTMQEISKKEQRVKSINLSRNFGQHYAITAGLHNCKGEWVVVMDCDLQDQPEEILKLYTKALEGYDIVFARREKRNDSFKKRMSSKLFHMVFRYLSGIDSDDSIANFGIYNEKVIQEYNKLKEVARSFPSLIQLLGFKQASVNVLHSQRFEGKTSYSLSTLIDLTGDVILSNSNKLLKLAIKIGLTISFISFILAFYNIAANFLGNIKVEGFTTTVFSIWFVGGILMLFLGIIGLYIGKIFDQVKERPLFVIKDKINFDE